jgi:hypothetical protein
MLTGLTFPSLGFLEMLVISGLSFLVRLVDVVCGAFCIISGLSFFVGLVDVVRGAFCIISGLSFFVASLDVARGVFCTVFESVFGGWVLRLDGAMLFVFKPSWLGAFALCTAGLARCGGVFRSLSGTT